MYDLTINCQESTREEKVIRELFHSAASHLKGEMGRITGAEQTRSYFFAPQLTRSQGCKEALPISRSLVLA